VEEFGELDSHQGRLIDKSLSNAQQFLSKLIDFVFRELSPVRSPMVPVP
jgi:hypothetical protein